MKSVKYYVLIKINNVKLEDVRPNYTRSIRTVNENILNKRRIVLINHSLPGVLVASE